MRMRTCWLVLATLAVCAGAAANDDVYFESEPNDVTPEILDMGVGAQPAVPVTFRIKGRIDTATDVDRFQLDLEPGDILGVAVTDSGGGDPWLRLENSAGEMLIENDDQFFGANQWWKVLPHPDEGWGGDALFARVITEADDYVVQVAGEDGATGRYRLDIMVARPVLEAYPAGTRQIVFVDFDGAKVNMSRFNTSGTKVFSPLSDFLGAWGLTAADEDAVIDAVLATLEENLSTDIRTAGLNGDYATSGVPGEFDIEIRNSRDHEDTYGVDPLVTRLVIGGTQEEAGVFYFAASSDDMPGNFTTDDDAFVLLDGFAGLNPNATNPNLNEVPLAPGRTIIELIGRTLGNVGAHELGHDFGCRHTDWTNTVVDLMDQGGPAGLGAGGTAVGPDGIFGTADDFDRDFGEDAYATVNHVFGGREPFRGRHDSLNTIAFGLATGRK